MSTTHILVMLQAIRPEVDEILTRPWETPATTSQRVLALLRSSTSWSETVQLQVIVAGSPDSQVLCLVDADQVLLYSPQTSLKMHPFVRELIEEFSICFEVHTIGKVDGGENCLTTPLSDRLVTRLTLPSVVLVSLFHPEMYPASRLTLGISYLASYLRLHFLANVEIIDCQFGASVNDIMAKLRTSQPDILGISVNFGQFDLLETLLNSLYSTYTAGEEPVVILGNILPVMSFQEIFAVYPRVVICRKEGELTLAELVRCGRDRTKWHRVPGIYYQDIQHNKLVSTPHGQLSMEELPPPALDTASDLFTHDGVITSEFSRGCQYNICSFCPRTHKGSVWKTLSVDSMIQQWKMFTQVFRHFQRTPHIFLADEDFIGIEDGDVTIKRITSFLDKARDMDLQITFDASCRADQIFRENRDRTWHVKRGQLFRECIEGGLSRLFLGVESGASAQLLRYNKGSSVEEMISAIRYLSLLGVQLRFGFIFFDPLMTVQDLIENIEFLGRTDVVLSAEHGSSIDEIFHYVSSNHGKLLQKSSGNAVYEDVSYMVSPLEVLAKSRYLYDLRQSAPQLLSQQLDVSFARYRATYTIPEIGLICKACQYWVNYCFPIVYTLKGLLKVSRGKDRKILSLAIKHHRYLGYLLIRDLAQCFSLVNSDTAQRWENMHPSAEGSEESCLVARRLILAGQIDEGITTTLVWYETMMRQLVETVNQQAITLSPVKREMWNSVYKLWMASSIAQSDSLRIN